MTNTQPSAGDGMTPGGAAERPLLGHISALDGVRGLAILLVMLFHQSEVLRDAVAKTGGPIDSFLLRVFRVGWSGVDLFFVLSGFLITGILLDAKARGTRGKRGVGSDAGSPLEAGIGGYFTRFYARRSLRIFPLYYAVLLVTLVIVPRLPFRGEGALARAVAEYSEVAPHQWWFWTYLSNFFFARHGFMDHGIPDVLWSLAIEEQFYLVWPIVVWVVPSRALVKVCVAVMGCALLLRCGLVWEHADPIAVYVLTPARLDTLACGGLLATLGREWGGLSRLVPTARLVAVGAGVALCTLFVRHATMFGATPAQYEPAMQTAGFTLIAVLFGAMIVLAVSAPAGSRLVCAMEWRPLRTVGKYAYAMYLFHLPLQSILRGPVMSKVRIPPVLGTSLPGQLVFNVVVTGVTFVVALLSWNLFERHFLRLKDRFGGVGL